MPNKEDYKILNKIEEDCMEELKDINGNLNIARQTADGERRIFFACKDFRMPSKVFFTVSQNYSSKFEIDYEIFKDKYWQSLNRFR